MNILIVDDEPNARKTLGNILKAKGYEAEEAGTGSEAVRSCRAKFFNLVLIDVRLPDMSGLEVLKAVHEINEDTIAIMMTAYASLDSSIEAMNKGAYSYITKPMNMDAVLVAIEKGLEKQRLSMENKQLLEELTVANEELKGLDKRKTAFTSMVSHELRTPLSALKESISQILEGMLGTINDGQRKFLEIGKRNVDRLARLIGEVLDFQTLETGKMVFKIQDNDINEVVKETKETMNIIAKEKGLDFILNLDNELPKIKFDRDKISQVLSNLVNNSLKLTEKGSITISTTRGNNIIQVSVKDTGLGIREEDMPRLFQQYEQLERKAGGTGLGLAISLDIIKAHGGKIWAESVFGQGTTMHFILPIEERRRRP